jgi:AcrR family transcriptional regulator
MDHWSKGVSGCMALARFHKLPPARRGELLGAAAEAFAEGGYDGTSFNKLIERLGLSKSQAYYYFEDKADLFATACAACYEDFYAEAAVLPLPASAREFWEYARTSGSRNVPRRRRRETSRNSRGR